MFGPVFLLEWKNASRRSRHFRFRTIYTAVVTLEFAVFLFGWFWRFLEAPALQNVRASELSELATTYLWLFTIQHFLLLLLVTPALAAGSVSDEKARGTFTVLLTTELTAGEIVVGKCLGQAVQMLVLALPAFPLVALLHGMCGLPPIAAVAWAVESALVALLLAALGLTASVWARKTTTAVVAVYVLFAGVAAGCWLSGHGNFIDGFTLINPAFWGVSDAWPALMLAAATLTVTCLAFSAWRLRPVCAAEGAPRPRSRWWTWLDRPAVTNAPLRWKERYVGELGLLTFARKLPRWAGIAAALSLGLLAALFVPGDAEVFLLHGLGMIAVVGFLVAVRSSGAICRERERQTWEGLLLTPLEPYDLVRGKLWGIVDSIKPYLLAYLAGTLVWAVPNGLWAVFCTILCWLSAWGFLYYQAANGLYHSARSPNSWRAMVYALVTGGTAILPGSGMWLAVLSCLVPIGLAFGLMVPVPFGVGPVMHMIAFGLILVVLVAFVCGLMLSRAEFLLMQTEQHIAEQERIVQGRGR